MHTTKVVRIKLSHKRMWRRAILAVVFVSRARKLCAMRKATRLTREEADEIRVGYRSFCAAHGYVTPVKTGSFFRHIGVAVNDAVAQNLAEQTVSGELQRAIDREEALRKLSLSITQVLKVAQQLKRQLAEEAVSEEELAFEAVKEMSAAAAQQQHQQQQSQASMSSLLSASTNNNLLLTRSASGIPKPKPAATATAAAAKVSDTEVQDCLTSFGISPAIALNNDAVPQSMQLSKFKELFILGGAAAAARAQQRARRQSLLAHELQQQQQQQLMMPSIGSFDQQQSQNSGRDSGTLGTTIPGFGDAGSTPGSSPMKHPQQQQHSPGSGLLGQHNTQHHHHHHHFAGIMAAVDDDDDDADDYDHAAASTLGAAGSTNRVLANLLRTGVDGADGGGGRRRKQKQDVVTESDGERIVRLLRAVKVNMELPPQLELDPAPIKPSRDMEGWRNAPELQKMTAAKNRFDTEGDVGRGTGVRVLPTRIGSKMLAEAAKFKSLVTKAGDDALQRATERWVKTPPPGASPQHRSPANTYRRTRQEELMHAEYIAAKKQAASSPSGGGGRQQVRVRRFLNANGEMVVADDDNNKDDDEDNEADEEKKWLRLRRRQRFVPFMARPIPRSELSKHLREALPSKSPAELCRPPAFLLSIDQRSQIGSKMVSEQGKLATALNDASLTQAVHGDARMAASMALNFLELRAAQQQHQQQQHGSTTVASLGAIPPPQPDWSQQHQNHHHHRSLTPL